MEKNILVLEDIVKQGIEFKEEVCFSGEFGQQVFDKPFEDGGNPITGLLFEKYNNGNLNYYSYYVDGIQNGESVTFYESGEISSYCVMDSGQVYGEIKKWYKTGLLKSLEMCKYGVVISSKHYDEKGDIIMEKLEPSRIEQKMLEKYEKFIPNKDLDKWKAILKLKQ